jgi:tripartite-type tricarboxylate transporter receptor subunit TctC
MKNFLRLMAAALVFASAGAVAQDWPKKPVRVIVANSPGSLSDLMARLIFARVAETLGQAFVIENKPGAGGSIAAAEVARAAPDGYTVIYSSDSQMTINPFLYKNLGYDPLRDFSPVSLTCKITQALYVSSNIGAKTLDDFVRLARANPGKLTYASGGNGHATHLSMGLFLWKANLDLVHVPYKGTGPALQAAAAGEVSALMIATSIAQPFVASGKLIPLATAGAISPDVLPGVPPLNSRFPGSELVSWQAVAAPAKTPPEIVRVLHDAIAKAVASRDVSDKLRAGGTDAVASTPEELGKLIHEEYERNRELLQHLKLKVD